MNRYPILVVDDDPLVRRSILRALAKIEDLEAVGAENVDEARKALSTRPFAVLITDYKMDVESGIDLLEHVVESHPQTVSILATAHADLELALDAVNRGHIHGLLTKPFTNSELILSVRQALDRFVLRQSLETKIEELEKANQLLANANRNLVRNEEELKRAYELAATDVKTGARSFRFFSDRLEEEVARALRYDRPLSLSLVDLDGFKKVNDRFGHVAGDAVLASVAELMRGSLRVVDVLARYGGDEFAIILPDTDIDGARTLGTRLRDRVRDARFDPADSGAITISMGIATIPLHGAESAEQLVSLADAALYRAKDAGKNRFSMPV